MHYIKWLVVIVILFFAGCSASNSNDDSLYIKYYTKSVLMRSKSLIEVKDRTLSIDSEDRNMGINEKQTIALSNSDLDSLNAIINKYNMLNMKSPQKARVLDSPEQILTVARGDKTNTIDLTSVQDIPYGASVMINALNMIVEKNKNK